MDLNFFSLAKAQKRQKQRDNHIRTILSTYNTMGEKKAGLEDQDIDKDSTNGTSPEKMVTKEIDPKDRDPFAMNDCIM